MILSTAAQRAGLLAASLLGLAGAAGAQPGPPPANAAAPSDAASAAPATPPDATPPAPTAATPPPASPAPSDATDSSGSRIVGGYDAPRGKRPWQVEIRVSPTYVATGKAKYTRAELARAPLWNWTHFCGGVLIAPDWILTAAHCVQPRDQAKGLIVQLGTQDLRTQGWFFKMDRILINKLWSFEGGPEDIALAHLTPAPAPGSPAGPPTYRPIPIAGVAADFDPSAKGDNVLVTGWGRTTVNNPNAPPMTPGAAPRALAPVTPPVLQEVALVTVDRPTCQTAFPGADLVGTICAQGTPPAPGRPPKDSCNGDSGGPMVRARSRDDYVLVGLVSWGADKCGTAPGVYTGVEFYTAWIRQQMGADFAKLPK
jgi:secreted trypsin-like serine protease